MSLRPENLLAFRMTSIPLTSLLHPEEFPTSVTLGSLASLGARFALVDHNKLLPQFGDASESVDAIIDHHDDEHAHLSAKVRIITVPTGSTTSLVTKHFQTQWQASLSSPAGAAGSPVPAELATLLLSGILIDTAGLKLGGKATAVDNDAAAFLYPLSPLSVGTNETLSSTALAGPGSKPKPLTDTYQALSQAKFDVSSLSTYQLLLRDYKEYNYPTSSTSYPSLRIGLSTVPLGLKAWLKEKEAKAGWNGLLEGVDGYMAERQLDLEGILTSYQSDKGKHKREIAIIARKGFAIKTNQEAKDVLMGVIAGLEASGQLLDLSTWEKSKGALLKRIISPSHHGRASVDDFMTNDGVGRYGKVWKQGNAKSTRKQVAPCLVSKVSNRVSSSCVSRTLANMVLAGRGGQAVNFSLGLDVGESYNMHEIAWATACHLSIHDAVAATRVWAYHNDNLLRHPSHSAW
jgi:exopolyphosphatase